MKKLITTTAAMVLSFASVAATPEEMLANKDYAGVENYCKTNKTNDALVNYVRVSNFDDWMIYSFTNNSQYVYSYGLIAYGKTNNIEKAINDRITDTWVESYPTSTIPQIIIAADKAKVAYAKFIEADAKYNLICCMAREGDFTTEQIKLAIDNSSNKCLNYLVLMCMTQSKNIIEVMKIYSYEKISLTYAFSMILKNHYYINCWNRYMLSKYDDVKFMYAILKDCVKYVNDDKIIVEAAEKVDALSENYSTEYLNIAYSRVSSFNYKLDIALKMVDIDKIIDTLLIADDTITAEQVNAIIKPINSVAADYRKDDILKALNNINSRCTIKLYDDQETWEPIISKIRAMIDVRK